MNFIYFIIFFQLKIRYIIDIYFWQKKFSESAQKNGLFLRKKFCNCACLPLHFLRLFCISLRKKIDFFAFLISFFQAFKKYKILLFFVFLKFFLLPPRKHKLIYKINYL